MTPINRLAAGVTVGALVLVQVALVLTGSQPFTLVTVPPWADRLLMVLLLFLGVRTALAPLDDTREADEQEADA